MTRDGSMPTNWKRENLLSRGAVAGRSQAFVADGWQETVVDEERTRCAKRV